MTNYIIIDDEPIAHNIIEKYCASFPNLSKVGNCYNAFEAIEILNKKSVDLMFLDLNMPKISGFEFLKTITNPPKVIVTTAYKEHALEGFSLNVVDYLLKPFSLERFMQAVNKAISSEVKQIINTVSSDQNKNSFFVKGDKKHYQINSDDILFIEAYGSKTKLFLETEMIICHQKISSFEELLSKDNFLRVHKSFIVALKKIKLVEGNQIVIGKSKVPIGQTYRVLVNKIIGI